MNGADATWVQRAREAAGGRPVLGIMGGGRATDADLRAAGVLGRLAAEAGWAVLTGGGGGIMEAACGGAREVDGITIGVLPFTTPVPPYPNPSVTVPLFTGLGALDPTTGDPGRNRINILASDVIAAFPGSAGTNSEIQLAAEHKRPLVLVGWRIDDLTPSTRESLTLQASRPTEARTPEEAMTWIRARGGSEGA